MDELSEDFARSVLGGSGWQLSKPLGTMQATRIASRGTERLAVKLTNTPIAQLRRLADLEVTPAIIDSSQHAGQTYLIQRAVTGAHPDHAWFADHLTQWADLLDRYLNDEILTELLRDSTQHLASRRE